MADVEIAQQIASLLTPALPYLVGIQEDASSEAPERVKDRFGEGWWTSTKQIFEIIRPEMEKKPEFTVVFKKAAAKAEDELAQAALTHELEKILENMPPETVNEIRTIISEMNQENLTATAQRENSGKTQDKEIILSRFAPLAGLDNAVKPQLYHCPRCNVTILAQDILWIKSNPYCDKCKNPVEPL